MVQQVTRGIKISVETTFEGTFYKYAKLYELQESWESPSAPPLKR